MVSDIGLAFDHPEARSRATGTGEPRDRISLRDHVREVEIGAFQAERGTTQRVQFNIVVEVRPQPQGEGPIGDDDVDRILSYDTLVEAIDHELAAERLNLLETLAERIAERILHAPLAMRCFVRIEKLDRGPGALGVEIVRSAAQLPRTAEEMDIPHPLVVFLSQEAMRAPHLAGWIDELAAQPRPVILCCAAPLEDAPQSAAPAAQRRIDLLAMEQAAWVLAGRDRRCIVTGTRTELDWAMKHGQMSVWAPSKIVLDSVETPPVGPRDAAALAGWFAGQMRAAQLLVVGEPVPPGLALPARSIAPGDAALAVD